MISFLIWNSNPVFYNYQTVVVCWTVRGHMLHVYVYLYVKSLFMVWSYLLDEITPCYEFILFNVNLKCKIMFLFYFIPRLVIYLLSMMQAVNVLRTACLCSLIQGQTYHYRYLSHLKSSFLMKLFALLNITGGSPELYRSSSHSVVYKQVWCFW